MDGVWTAVDGVWTTVDDGRWSVSVQLQLGRHSVMCVWNRAALCSAEAAAVRTDAAERPQLELYLTSC